MSRPNRYRFAPSPKAALAAATVALLLPATAGGAGAMSGAPGVSKAERDPGWTRTMALDLSARELGLPLLSPRPTLAEVARAFYLRAEQIYGTGARGSAHTAFSAVGLPPS